MLLPIELVESLGSAPGFDKDAFIQVHENRESITSIRMNPLKPVDIGSIEYLSGKVPWSSAGYYLSQRPFFTFDPLLHAGAYYVQEASSMFLEEAIRQTVDLARPVIALDLCAAPGGKSTLIQSLLNRESMIVSNEVIKSRVTILEENLIKWGGVNRVITNNDPKDFRKFPGIFDLVVVDAPCSGSGLFRRDPDLIKEWSPANVQMCSQRQQRILADILPSIKEDGILIYSTCSYSLEEDELIADWLVRDMNMEPVSLNIQKDWNIVQTETKEQAITYRFYPDKIKGEGFFICCLRKKQQGIDPEGASYFSRKSSKLDKVSKNELALVEDMVKTEGLLCWKFGDRILAIQQVHEKLICDLLGGLYIKNAGISLGKPSAKELIPDHELAMSTIYKEGIARIALKKQDALQYLRREEVKLDGNERGWVLATYNEIPLGWIKVLPNRINNYYPKEWRILKSGSN